MMLKYYWWTYIINYIFIIIKYIFNIYEQIIVFIISNRYSDMNIIELTILNKLKKYQEKANRDRFILPIENDISLFTNIIDNCIHNFYI